MGKTGKMIYHFFSFPHFAISHLSDLCRFVEIAYPLVIQYVGFPNEHKE